MRKRRDIPSKMVPFKKQEHFCGFFSEALTESDHEPKTKLRPNFDVFLNECCYAKHQIHNYGF